MRGKSPPRSKPTVFRYPLCGIAQIFPAATATRRRSLSSMPATPKNREFLRFFCEAKNGAFATACDMPSIPINHEFLRFFAKQKMEPSRPSKNSKSKQQLATCPQRPKMESSRQLATCPQYPSITSFYVFLRSKKWSLRDQVKTQRASNSLRHALNAQKLVYFSKKYYHAWKR